MSVGNLIIKHSKLLLENKQRAILYAVALSVLPFASWLSVALVALVTLRKGAQCGFEIMLPALIAHSVPFLLMQMPLASLLVNTLIAYLPCYIAAIYLRKTRSWSIVSGVFFIQALLGFYFIQLMAPDFALGQFNQFKNALTQIRDYQQYIDATFEGLSSFVLAQLFLAIQILSVIVSAMISLLFARSIQAKLFMPGGFKNELLSFRSGRLSFLVLLAVSVASYYQISYAISLLPLVLCYFLLSGFGLAHFILAGKNQIRVAILLFLLILLKPSFVLLAYVIIGSLDSLFNFRLYLPARVRESI